MISGLPFISAVAMEDMEGNVDDEKTFQAVFFVFNSLWIYKRKSHCVIMFSFLNMYQNTAAYMIFLQYKQLCR